MLGRINEKDVMTFMNGNSLGKTNAGKIRAFIPKYYVQCCYAEYHGAHFPSFLSNKPDLKTQRGGER